MTQGIQTKTIISIFLVLALFLSMNNVTPLSPIFVILSFYLFLPTVFYSTKVSTYPLFVTCIILFIYCYISAFASGIPLSTFLKYDFYRYDGNVFYSYCPLILLPLIYGHKLNLDKILKYFVIVSAFSVLVFHTFLGVKFFSAHNAFGGFMLIVILVNVCFLNEKKMYIPLLINCYLIYVSDSRGSMIGVLIAILVITMELRKMNVLKKIIISFLLLILISISLYGYKTWIDLGKPQDVSWRNINDFEVKDLFSTNRNYTINERIYFLWPVAIDDFLRSPIIGIGFSRYNDQPYHFIGAKNFIELNNSDEISLNDSHAHHSVYHIASELGIIGICLFIVIFKEIFKYSRGLRFRYFMMVRLLTYALIFASFTEHRITTPSQMFPYFIILVLIFSGVKCMSQENQLSIVTK